MHEPPDDVSDADVLAAVREHWNPAVAAVDHVAIGFGAWHWQAATTAGPVLFVSLDQPLWHTPATAEATYAGAATLAESLDFVHPPRASRVTGRLTVPMGGSWLTVTDWLDGERPARFVAEAAEVVRRLHATSSPEGVPGWQPQVQPGLVDELRDWTVAAWADGPHGEEARALVRGGLARVERQVATYVGLIERLDPSTFVPTHGEPGVHNQWRTHAGRLLLLDWETLRLAPRERDLWDLPELAQLMLEPDPVMAGLFQLDWILSEVRTFSDWLRQPHRDDADTRTALGGLRHELTRPAFSLP